MAAETLAYGSAKALSTNTFTRAGYTFAGWAKTNTGAKAYANKASVENLTATNGATVTLFALWTPVTYTIAYHLAGGTVSGNPTTYKITTTAFTLKNPARAGYTFAGWTGTGLSKATVTVKVTKGSTGNRSYTATWKAK